MPSILIVDDDPNIRALFSRALAALGDIDQAPGGADALRFLGAKHYDVMLLDLHMPVVDGFMVLQVLSTRPGPNQSMPVFVITADTTDKARVDALRRKAVFLLTKPVNLGTLTSLVEGALRMGPTRRTARPGSVPDIDPTFGKGGKKGP